MNCYETRTPNCVKFGWFVLAALLDWKSGCGHRALDKSPEGFRKRPPSILPRTIGKEALKGLKVSVSNDH